MTNTLTRDSLYRSARDFAYTALVALNEEDFRRAAVDAATCLEHLAKACLASRSPALLTELKNEKNFSSLLRLLGIPDKDPPKYLRTVGLRDALVRVDHLVISPASMNDLFALVDMRDGSIHAAQNEEIKERLVFAFLQHADALLKDLQSDRDIFWSDHLDVVDALLSDESDKTAYRVSLKMATARAEYQKFEAKTPVELQNLIPRMYEYRDLEVDEELADCPACPSKAMALGYHDVEWIDDTGDGEKKGQVWFYAHGIRCPVCKLWLTGFAEVAAVMDSKWEVTNADPVEWESMLPDSE